MNDFDLAIRETLPAGLTCDDMDTLQINLGRRCNLSCVHCFGYTAGAGSSCSGSLMEGNGPTLQREAL
jgi:hypothetical protein